MLRYMDCIYETGKDLLSAWRFPFFDFRLFRDALHVRRRRLKAIAQLFSRMALSRTNSSAGCVQVSTLSVGCVSGMPARELDA